MPDLTREDLSRLRELAERAIPGKWDVGFADDEPGPRYLIGGGTILFATVAAAKHPDYDFASTAQFMAACDPTTVIALIEENKRLREALYDYGEHQSDCRRKWHHGGEEPPCTCGLSELIAPAQGENRE